MVKRSKKYEITASPRSAIPEGVMIFGAPLAVEYPAPTLFVVGPDSEMSQFENPGQMYVSTDDGFISIWIP